MIDCDLYEQSRRITTENMSAMAANESLRNFYNMNNFMHPMVSYDIPYYHIDKGEHTQNEFELMKGFQVHKKSCIYKRPNYNEGSWVNQFTRIMPDELENKFNIITRSKNITKNDNLD